MARSDDSTQPALTVEELVLQVRALAEGVAPIASNTRWYLFGSALHDPLRAADIDLLIVCQSHYDADVIRQFLSGLVVVKPIDLSILTEAEESETNFVCNQHCTQIFPYNEVELLDLTLRKLGRRAAG